ncbi:hypothetical protein OOT46_09545 [Aquabacterium sp. A7-Y]|uniref:hypothetical protein n=1 Tax=Aquabacterium sp. A7-Y TaxID=1349605 RepID=UPI00223D0B6B|nr:hypothetical protein [Aquabacterium sp. A7-Y]MCW7538091.1 hypothetical protein [Aquabacterium sp. A7-Y]
MPLSESCDAILTINAVEYEGETGHGHGHAEMDALHNFIEAQESEVNTTTKLCILAAKQILETTPIKVVLCPSRPVCLKCSSILRQLGFALGPKTDWGTKTAGKTEWGVSQNVAALLKECGINLQKTKDLA